MSGSCDLKGYAVFMNDGHGSDIFTEIDSEVIRNKPMYTEHTITHLMDEGATYIVFVQAYNINGATNSESMAFVLASKPATPIVAPTSDLMFSSATQLKIDVQMISDNGGSPITTYSIELDDGMGGAFSIVSSDLKLTYTETAA